MRVSEHFSGNFLKTDDVTRQGSLFQIISIEVDKVGKDEKWVARLASAITGEEMKGLPLNKTNALELAEAYGDDSDDWSGKNIIVYQDKTMFDGKRVACIRVRIPTDVELSALDSSAARSAAAAD